jgi:hypothetical protein
MYYPDLSPYEYAIRLGPVPGSPCQKLNIGWLGRDREFPKGDVAEPLLKKLFRLSRIGLDRMRGWHSCELCWFSRSGFRFKMDGQAQFLGDAEIEVCGKSGVIYRVPNLICHYIRDHHYKPPDEFLRALEEMDVPED